jgi:hypothetical protein
MGDSNHPRTSCAFLELPEVNLMRIRATWVSLISLAVFIPLLSAQVWTKKDYHEWSLEDCAKVLRDSPWSKSRILASIAPREIGASVPGRDQEATITYQVQFLSSVSVRQALARQAELGPSFQRLSVEDQQAAREKYTKLIANPYTDQVVVRLLYGTSMDSLRLEMVRMFRTNIQGQWQVSTFLNTPAAHMSPVQVDASQDGVVIFVFPRLKDGKPVVQPGDKEFSFEFMSPAIGQFSSQHVILFFKVKDMLVNEKVSY